MDMTITHARTVFVSAILCGVLQQTSQIFIVIKTRKLQAEFYNRNAAEG